MLIFQRDYAMNDIIVKGDIMILKKLFLTLLLVQLLTSLIAKAFGQDSGKVIVIIDDNRNKFPGVSVPLYHLNDGYLIGITDSTGTATINLDSTYLDVNIRSYFYKDTTFRVNRGETVTIYIKPVEILLREIVIKSLRINPLIKRATKRFKREYIAGPNLLSANGYYTIESRGKYLEFYQMDGIALHSGYLDWKPFRFSPTPANGKSYFCIVPLELRRTYHWGVNGDTVAPKLNSPDYLLRYLLKPFSFREVYRALEVSGPCSYKNRKFYDFSLEEGNEPNDYFLIHFRTKDKYRSKRINDLLLIGEGILWISRQDQKIKRIEYDFSQYHNVDLPANRKGRIREIYGTIIVSYVNYPDGLFIDVVDFSCRWWGNHHIYRPRPMPFENRIHITEHIDIRKIKKCPDVQLLQRENIAKMFDYIGDNSLAKYDPSFWDKQTNISTPPDLKQIFNDLSLKIKINNQFIKNSGKRFYPWDEGNYSTENSSLLKSFPNAKNVAEARKQWENGANDYMKQLNDCYIKKFTQK